MLPSPTTIATLSLILDFCPNSGRTSIATTDWTSTKQENISKMRAINHSNGRELQGAGNCEHIEKICDTTMFQHKINRLSLILCLNHKFTRNRTLFMLILLNKPRTDACLIDSRVQGCRKLAGKNRFSPRGALDN